MARVRGRRGHCSRLGSLGRLGRGHDIGVGVVDGAPGEGGLARVAAHRGRPLDEQEVGALVALAERLRPHYEAIRVEDPENAPTFFELITAAALLEFAERKVDVAVLETGLGGRLDATNVCAPEVCVITSIGLDHQEYLGDTLERIAGEKAGIIKDQRPVVVADQPEEAMAVLAATLEVLGDHAGAVDLIARAVKQPDNWLQMYNRAEIGRAHV